MQQIKRIHDDISFQPEWTSGPELSIYCRKFKKSTQIFGVFWKIQLLKVKSRIFASPIFGSPKLFRQSTTKKSMWGPTFPCDQTWDEILPEGAEFQRWCDVNIFPG